jgi:hypothetical protein
VKTTPAVEPQPLVTPPPPPPPPRPKHTAAPGLELPSAPIGSLAGFSGMKFDPSWVELGTLNSQWSKGFYPRGQDTDLSGRSQYLAQA